MFETATRIIKEMATSITFKDRMFNERYLHHYFSHRLQSELPTIDILKPKTLLHPEWPTFKKSTEVRCAKYKNFKSDTNSPKGYHPVDLKDDDGSAGFIDFALGEYKEPTVGIEFILKYGWGHEEVIYDYIKLLDSRNPFKNRISYIVILREKHLVKGGFLKSLVEHMNGAYKKAVELLNEQSIQPSRDVLFLISEIEESGKRRHWHFDMSKRCFVDGL